MFTASVCCSSHGSEDVTAKTAPMIKVQQPLSDGREADNFIVIFWIWNCSNIATHLLAVLVFCCCWAIDMNINIHVYSWGDALQKSLRLRRFKWDRDEIWRDCFSSKYAWINVVGFLTWRHTFKMAAMTSARRLSARLPSACDVIGYSCMRNSSWSIP